MANIANDSVDYSTVMPLSVKHGEVKKIIYAERKKMFFHSGGDIELVTRARYSVNDTVTYEYMVDREVIPGLRKYLESKGRKTTLSSRIVSPEVLRGKEKDAIKNPGFNFTYKGVEHSGCLVERVPNGKLCFALVSSHPSMYVVFTHASRGGNAPGRVVVIDDEIYKWLSMNGFILKEHGSMQFAGRTAPDVTIAAARLLGKGRLGRVIAKEEITGEYAIGEDSIRIHYMSSKLKEVRECEEKAKEARFRLSMAGDYGDDAEADKWEARLAEAEKEYNEILDKTVIDEYLAQREGAVFAERFAVSVSKLRKDGDFYFYAIAKGKYAGWELCIGYNFVETPDNSDIYYIALPVGEKCLIVKNEEEKRVPFNQVVSILEKG